MGLFNLNRKISLNASFFSSIDLGSFQQTMKDVDWPEFSRRFFRAFLDLKNLAACIGIFVIVVMVGMEHIYSPMMKDIDAVDVQIKQKQDEEKKSRELQNQYKSWQSALKDVQSQFLAVHPGESPRVVALKESENLVAIARGDLSESTLKSTLPAPNDGVTVKSVVFEEERSTPLNLAATIPESDTSILSSLGQDKATIQIVLDRYVYKLTLEGTYPALAAYINNIVSRRRVMEITELSFKPDAPAENKPASGNALENNAFFTSRPDPAMEPDAPVPVTMEMVVTIYLQSDAAPAAQ